MSDEFDSMMLKVLLHLLAIDVVDVLVSDRQTSSPFLVAVGKVPVVYVEDSIDEGEVVFYLLITLDVETSMASGRGSLSNGSFKVRHVEMRRNKI